jgi:hypothetical protein
VAAVIVAIGTAIAAARAAVMAVDTAAAMVDRGVRKAAIMAGTAVVAAAAVDMVEAATAAAVSNRNSLHVALRLNGMQRARVSTQGIDQHKASPENNQARGSKERRA